MYRYRYFSEIPIVIGIGNRWFTGIPIVGKISEYRENIDIFPILKYRYFFPGSNKNVNPAAVYFLMEKFIVALSRTLPGGAPCCVILILSVLANVGLAVTLQQLASNQSILVCSDRIDTTRGSPRTTLRGVDQGLL